MPAVDPMDAGAIRPVRKTLLVCCDGTWMNAVGKMGQNRPGSNVARLVHVVRSATETGMPQVVLYHPGVGSSGQLLDGAMGGAFGMGLDQDIRELYDFVCLNYNDGDAIVLVGFSRGAFTARSVADLIASVGLLTPEGLERFYDIFKDYENMGSKQRAPADFLCPGLTPYRGEKGEDWLRWEHERKKTYRRWLKKNGYTRDTLADGHTPITIKALGVWDTVGSLGIPAAPVIGLKGSAQMWKFTNTHISSKVEHAFQALALDEPRYDFLPSLWERLPSNRTTQLKQVWFPGAHSNVGGGLHDQQVANIALAWMCDQLTSVGVEFDRCRMAAVFREGLRYSAAHPFPSVPPKKPTDVLTAKLRRPLPWAGPGVFAASPDTHGKRDAADCPGKYACSHPSGTPQQLWRLARPWALGQTRCPTSKLQLAAGKGLRLPGQFVRVDPESNDPLPREPLLNTAERVHACVRVRLACGGLGMDDRAVWTCRGLTGAPRGDDSANGSDSDSDDGLPLWHLEAVHGPVALAPADLSAAAATDPELYPLSKVLAAGRWQWVYVGDRRRHKPSRPPVTVLPEELPTGRWERMLLAMTVGETDVLAWATAHPYRME